MANSLTLTVIVFPGYALFEFAVSQRVIVPAMNGGLPVAFCGIHGRDSGILADFVDLDNVRWLRSEYVRSASNPSNLKLTDIT
jgi:hypothetical protein